LRKIRVFFFKLKIRELRKLIVELILLIILNVLQFYPHNERKLVNFFIVYLSYIAENYIT